MRREALVLDEVDERAGDDEQDIDAVLREAGERGGILDFIDAAFDLAFVGEVVGLGIVERFPGPGEGVRIVGTDLENAGLVEPGGGVAAVEELVETLRVPGFEGVEDGFGVGGFRGEGVVEELFEVPAEFGHQVGVGAVCDGPLVGRGEGDGVGGFAVVAAEDEGLILVIDDLRFREIHSRLR